jgi:GxxExxY protein
MESDLGASAPQRLRDKREWEFPHGELTERILGVAIHVHRQLGPGFLEKMYENALCLELTKNFQRQVPVRVLYDGEEVGRHVLDLIVERKVVVEIKPVKEIEDVHLAIVLSYLRATGLAAGLVVNYRAARLGIRRVVSTGRSFAETRRSGGAEEEA